MSAKIQGRYILILREKVKTCRINYTYYRHLREIDCSSAVVGGLAAAWAMVLNPGAKQCTGPTLSTKACFMVAGDITTSVNKGRWAVPLSSILIKKPMVLTYFVYKTRARSDKRTVWKSILDVL